jgi:hypothetical protein
MLNNSLKGLKELVLICLLLPLLVACQTTKTVYVDRIVEVKVDTPAQLMQECNVSERKGEKVIDYITSERRLRNDLNICNLMIRARNENEVANKVTQK